MGAVPRPPPILCAGTRPAGRGCASSREPLYSYHLLPAPHQLKALQEYDPRLVPIEPEGVQDTSTDLEVRIGRQGEEVAYVLEGHAFLQCGCRDGLRFKHI